MFIQGSLTALATPFTPRGIDEGVFADLVDWQIREGTQGLVPCGTTGEGSTPTVGERERLTRICGEGAIGRVPGSGGIEDTTGDPERPRVTEFVAGHRLVQLGPVSGGHRPFASLGAEP